MNRRTGIIALAIAGVIAAAPAHADKDRALALYADAKAKYKAGDYTSAIELFEKAYAENASPAFLFNIAQAYRQLDDCPNALRHYRKFVGLKPDGQAAAAPHIQELSARCAAAVEPVGEPATDANRVSESAEAASAAADSPPLGSPPVVDAPTDQTTTARTSVPGARAARISLVAEVGATFFDVGDVVTPVTPTLRVGAAYPVPIGRIAIEIGAVAEFARMPYKDAMGDSNASWTTLLVNAGSSAAFGRLRLGGEVGAGVLMLSALAEGNPFSDGMTAAGSSKMFAFRLGGLAEYGLAHGLSLSASPALAYAVAADGLRDQISAVTRVELLGGLRYRW